MLNCKVLSPLFRGFQVFNLSNLFFKIYIKQKAIPLFIILAILSVMISSAISGIDIGDKSGRLFLDVTIFLQSSILTIMAIFFPLNYLERESKNGVFIIPFSAGVNRKVYFSSVLISQIFTLLTLFSFFLFVDLIYIFIFKIDEILIFQLLLSFLSATILISLIISIGQYTSSLKALIYSLIIYFIGNGLDELYIYSFQLHPDEVLQNLYLILSKIVPNFYIFDSDKISVYPIFHSFIQISIFSILGYLKFSKKVLKVEN